MKLVKIIPKTERAIEIVMLHGSEMEILFDKEHSVLLRSLEYTNCYSVGNIGKWIGSLTKEEASWEEV